MTTQFAAGYHITDTGYATRQALPSTTMERYLDACDHADAVHDAMDRGRAWSHVDGRSYNLGGLAAAAGILPRHAIVPAAGRVAANWRVSRVAWVAGDRAAG